MPEFHIRGIDRWEPITLDIVKDDLYSGAYTTRFSVLLDGASLGKIERTKDHVSHQVHDRIRYDNKPVTVWRALPATPGLYNDTRNEAIAELTKLGLESSTDLHLAHRAPWWVGCTLHEES